MTLSSHQGLNLACLPFHHPDVKDSAMAAPGAPGALGHFPSLLARSGASHLGML